jgi:hypothetical protein
MDACLALTLLLHRCAVHLLTWPGPHLQDILRNLVVPCEENPLPVSELEIDEFQFHYTGMQTANVLPIRTAA